jgi:CubicO group peptidase (beta-lactamase class C family)
MSKYEDLTVMLQQFVKSGPPGCGCALAKDGKTLYENYFGVSDIETGAPVTADTVYRLFSMTKVIVCTAALMLFERGKYLLNDPLYEYFPEYREMSKFVTDGNGIKHIEKLENSMLVRHAFSMAVGMPYFIYDSDTSRAMTQVTEKLSKNGKYNLQTEIKAMSEVPV